MRIDHSRLANYLVIVVLMVALMVLYGWSFDIEFLKRPVPLLAAMNPWTAFNFILLSCSFLLINVSCSRPNLIRVSRLLALVAMVIASLKLILPVAVWPLNKLLFAEKVAASIAAGLPSSMAINTAISFVFAGGSLLLWNSKIESKQRAAHYLALGILVFSLFSMLGYLYKAKEFLQIILRLPMAVHTAGCFILFSLAILISQPHTGLVKEISTRFYGGYLARFLIPVAVLVPILLGWIYLFGYAKSLYSVQFGVTILVTFIIILFCFFIWFSAIRLNRKDNLKLQTEEKLQEIEEDFNTVATSIKDYAIFIMDVEGRILSWNKGAELIKGYTEEEIKGCNFDIFYTEEDKRSNLPQLVLDNAKLFGSYELEGYRIKKDSSRFWATIVITALYNNDGTLRGFVKLTRDATETKKTKDILSDFNAELNRQVIIKTAILEKTASQLRQLAAHLQTVREDEREKIGRELHDQLGQLFTGLRMDFVWLRKKMTIAGGDVLERFDRALELLDETYKTMRRIATELHPSLIRNLGLTDAVDLYCRQFTQRSGVQVLLKKADHEKDDHRISGEISIGVYRIFQECMTNVLKHAVAHTVNVWLEIKDETLILGIEDDGKGFDPDNLEDNKTLGLISIRERILMLKEQYRIDSSVGEGTLVWVEIPIN